jgi:hypothetical protein
VPSLVEVPLAVAQLVGLDNVSLGSKYVGLQVSGSGMSGDSCPKSCTINCEESVVSRSSFGSDILTSSVAKDETGSS